MGKTQFQIIVNVRQVCSVESAWKKTVNLLF